jgi:hypothetical protein
VARGVAFVEGARLAGELLDGGAAAALVEKWAAASRMR